MVFPLKRHKWLGSFSNLFGLWRFALNALGNPLIFEHLWTHPPTASTVLSSPHKFDPGHERSDLFVEQPRQGEDGFDIGVQGEEPLVLHDLLRTAAFLGPGRREMKVKEYARYICKPKLQREIVVLTCDIQGAGHKATTSRRTSWPHFQGTSLWSCWWHFLLFFHVPVRFRILREVVRLAAELPNG